MRTISWSYDVFYSWYKKQIASGPNADPLLAIVYESKRPSKRDIGKLEPFVRPNIAFVGEAPIQDSELFPRGMYMLLETEPKDRKWMFLVYPTLETCPPNGTNKHLVANHFTFVLNHTDRTNPCHFHRTVYACAGPSGEDPSWVQQHIHDHFPATLHLSRTGTTDAIIHKPANQRFKNAILDIMRFPWTSSSPSSFVGGVKKRVGVAHRPIQSAPFAILWLEEEFKELHAIGVRDATGIQWSVSLVRKRKGRHPWKPAYVFRTATDNEAVFQDTLAALITETYSR
jgi:hypothetical protein